MNYEIFCSSSVKNVTGNLIGIALNLSEEALLEDDRIISVESFSAEASGENMKISFVAKTVFGDVSVERGERIVGL